MRSYRAVDPVSEYLFELLFGVNSPAFGDRIRVSSAVRSLESSDYFGANLFRARHGLRTGRHRRPVRGRTRRDPGRGLKGGRCHLVTRSPLRCCATRCTERPRRSRPRACCARRATRPRHRAEPVVVAGLIDRPERVIEALCAGAVAFTVGTAVLDGVLDRKSVV